nr:MAG TPA: hypothetical protein [Caudoviricetes sp.]
MEYAYLIAISPHLQIFPVCLSRRITRSSMSKPNSLAAKRKRCIRCLMRGSDLASCSLNGGFLSTLENTLSAVGSVYPSPFLSMVILLSNVHQLQDANLVVPLLDSLSVARVGHPFQRAVVQAVLIHDESFHEPLEARGSERLAEAAISQEPDDGRERIGNAGCIRLGWLLDVPPQLLVDPVGRLLLSCHLHGRECLLYRLDVRSRQCSVQLAPHFPCCAHFALHLYPLVCVLLRMTVIARLRRSKRHFLIWNILTVRVGAGEQVQLLADVIRDQAMLVVFLAVLLPLVQRDMAGHDDLVLIMQLAVPSLRQPVESRHVHAAIRCLAIFVLALVVRQAERQHRHARLRYTGVRLECRPRKCHMIHDLPASHSLKISNQSAASIVIFQRVLLRRWATMGRLPSCFASASRRA